MIKIDGDYTDYRDDSDPDYPGGKAVDSPDEDGYEGTPYKADWMNDINGFRQALFIYAFGSLAGVNNLPDNAYASDTLNALKKLFSEKANISNPVFAGIPKVPYKTGAASNDGTLIATEAQVFQKKKCVTLVVGASNGGHSLSDVDYLCNGSNDTTQINAAITALPSSGGKIVIREGTYNITGAIYVNKNNVTIKGNGDSTVLDATVNITGSDTGLINITGSGCKLTGLKITNNSSVSVIYGIYISGSGNSIAGITVSNIGSSGYGIYIYGNYNSITGNTISNSNSSSSYGFYISGSNNSIAGNTVSNSSDSNLSHGIGIYGNSNRITGNTVSNSGSTTSYGIGIYSSNNSIIGNTISNISSNMSYGIYNYNGSNNSITGNTVFNSSGGTSYGIYINNSCNSINGNTFSNNSSESTGIFIYGSYNNITGNTVSNSGSNTSYGIRSGGNNHIINSNIISNSAAVNAFAYYNAATSYSTFHGNNLRGISGPSAAAYTTNGTSSATLVGSATAIAAWSSGSCGFNIV
ncbi:MAG: right-handed parallel beta-helix repeat-containing protein [Treponema sp.]|nr:right-handed parallel beta-helix repeat-containing protein [Treponema sp.]